MNSIETLRAGIRDVADFPKPGIVFKDITPILADPKLFRLTIDWFANECRDAGVEKIAGIDARGFLFGATVADRLGLGFVPIRKKGKLPYKTYSLAYKLEYGEAEIEVHTDAFQPGEKVAIIDDLLATGGTAGAAAKLLANCGADVQRALFLVELAFLNGREALPGIEIRSILTY